MRHRGKVWRTVGCRRRNLLAGMHSWRVMVDLLEQVNRPQTLGFQADMAHTLLYLLGYNAPEDALLGEGYDWSNSELFYEKYRQLTDALRPWTIDFHVAQTTPPCLARDRTTRPDDIACRMIPMASSISPKPLVIGCATPRASSLRPAAISAGMAACSRTKRCSPRTPGTIFWRLCAPSVTDTAGRSNGIVLSRQSTTLAVGVINQ